MNLRSIIFKKLYDAYLYTLLILLVKYQVMPRLYMSVVENDDSTTREQQSPDNPCSPFPTASLDQIYSILEGLKASS